MPGGGAFADGYWKGSITTPSDAFYKNRFWLNGNANKYNQIETELAANPTDEGRIYAVGNNLAFSDAGTYFITATLSAGGAVINPVALFSTKLILDAVQKVTMMQVLDSGDNISAPYSKNISGQFTIAESGIYPLVLTSIQTAGGAGNMFLTETELINVSITRVS